MAGVTSTNTSSDEGATRKFIKGSDRGTLSGSISLIDNSFAVSQDYSVALHNRLGGCQRLVEKLTQPVPGSTLEETRC